MAVHDPPTGSPDPGADADVVPRGASRSASGDLVGADGDAVDANAAGPGAVPAFAGVAFDGAAGGEREARTLGVEGLVIAAAAFLVGIVFSSVAVAVWAAVVGVSATDKTLGLQLTGLLGLWIGLLGVPLVAASLRGRGGPVTDLRWGFRWSDVPIGAVAGVGTAYAINVLYSPFLRHNAHLQHQFSQPAKEITKVAHDTGGKVLLSVFVVVLVPLVEESYFRGVIFRSLDRLVLTPVAVVLSGLLFGLAHGELLQLPALALFGAVLAVLAHRSGRLGPGMVAHAAFNGLTVFQLFHK